MLTCHADIVGTIAYNADIPGSTIGEISILDKHTMVDIPQQYVEQALAKAGKFRIRKNAVTLVLAETTSGKNLTLSAHF